MLLIPAHVQRPPTSGVTRSGPRREFDKRAAAQHAEAGRSFQAAVVLLESLPPACGIARRRNTTFRFDQLLSPPWLPSSKLVLLPGSKNGS